MRKIEEELAPIDKIISGLYEIWYEDGRVKVTHLNRLEAYRLANNPMDYQIAGMKRIVERRKTKRGAHHV